MIHTSKIKLFAHQIEAVSKLRTGSILLGGVGSGKTITSLAYVDKEHNDKELYIITTAKKRDSLDWENEADNFRMRPFVDSWNNISKYTDIEDSFFIFDEQKLVGSGAWVKSFLKIAKKNKWILLTATPGDSWIEYVAVFVANGFYKNRTSFIREHVIYNSFVSFPKIDRYINEAKLKRLRDKITVRMNYKNKTTPHYMDIIVPYDKVLYEKVTKERWNPYKNKPIKNAAELCYLQRKVVNSDISRIGAISSLNEKHYKLIIFYNFDYELEILREYGESLSFPVAEYNGHLHEDIPKADRWLYFVQYTSGSEAWNCTDTNTIVFFSLNYSYKINIQAGGRIDRMNTLYSNLYYYYIRSEAPIDIGINFSIKTKTDFNEAQYLRKNKLYF